MRAEIVAGFFVSCVMLLSGCRAGATALSGAWTTDPEKERLELIEAGIEEDMVEVLLEDQASVDVTIDDSTMVLKNDSGPHITPYRVVRETSERVDVELVDKHGTAVGSLFFVIDHPNIQLNGNGLEVWLKKK